MELTAVGVYRRTVRASLERIWENVLDWEHLPVLHRETFAHVRLLEAGPAGWRAESALRTAPRAGFVLDVTIERPELRYHTRTLDGPGTGTDIVTCLEQAGPGTTRIAVEFLVPAVSPERAARLGARYSAVYTRLWDQDESMMVRRQAVLDATRARGREDAGGGAAVPLGSAESLRARTPLLVEAHGHTYRVVDVDGRLLAHDTVCPHWGGPLDDAPVVDGCLTCPWHGYRFDVRSGRSADGRALSLGPAPRVVRNPSDDCTLVF